MVNFFIKNIACLFFLLLLSQGGYSKCVSFNTLNYDEIKFSKINYFNLQGNNESLEQEISQMNDNYYKDYILGYSYLIGKNKLKNYTLAEQYLTKSALYCFSPAHYSLGYLYYIENNFEEARKWFLSAKELGDNLAAHQLAIIYKKENNSEKMLENLYFSESHGFTPSITELGVTYYDGIFVKKDSKKAFEYFERAALKNDPLAQNNLGWMYEHGEGTEINIEKAEYWYRIASENGFELATKNLNKLNNTSENKISF